MPTNSHEVLYELASPIRRRPKVQFAVFLVLTVFMTLLFIALLVPPPSLGAIPVFFGLVGGVLGMREARAKLRSRRESVGSDA